MPNHLTHLDALDYHILQQLNQDARKPAADIARALGAQERTVRNRIDRLVSLGAVRFAAIVDHQLFGYGLSVDIFIEVIPDQEQAIVEHLLHMPEISYLAYSQGANEISLEARFKSSAELYDFLHRTLPAIPGLKVTSYALVPRTLRNIDQWLPRPEDFGLPAANEQNSG